MKEDLCIGRIRGRDVIVPHEAQQQARRLAGELAVLLGTKDIESSLFSYWSLSARRNQWESVLNLLPEARRGGHTRFLDVGCGLGLFVLTGRLLGLDCEGVEPSDDQYQGSVDAARALMHGNGMPPEAIHQSGAESLSLPDGAYDVVCCFQVLEHVKNPRKALQEIHRILAPGGMLFLKCPNYRYPYEGHYGMTMPCTLGKGLTAWWMRRRGYPAGFLQHLQWITPGKIRTWLAQCGYVRGRVGAGEAGAPVGLHLDMEDCPLPYAFTRGVDDMRRLDAFMQRPWIRRLASRMEIFPQITCVAWKAG